MKKIILLYAVVLFCMPSLMAQLPEYRRSSLYSILIQHPEKEYYRELAEVFHSIPVPDKFDDHNLSIRVLDYSQITGNTSDNRTIELFSNDIDTTQFISWNSTALKPSETVSHVTNWLKSNGVARRMVAKWFDRNKDNGSFDMNLIAQRGLYDASAIDVAIARRSVRGINLLADAGEELIGNTFVIINDIKYIDKEARAQRTKEIFEALGSAAAQVGGYGVQVSQLSTIGSAVSGSITGFSVSITTHLYRLDWDEETANNFYQTYYYDRQSLSPDRKAAFERDLNMFKLTYVGSSEAKSAKTTLRGVLYPEDMIRKVCTRAIDNNIVTLQRKYDFFKVKIPLTGVEPLKAPVGVKEGVSNRSQFEVLERIENENGRVTYRRQGIIQPVSGKIWDNTYMSTEEGYKNASLNATEFKRVSGGPFAPGMLIREIKF